MGGGEVVLIVVAILLLFGADKIPEFARTWGKGMREFRKAAEDIRRELESSSPVNDLKKEFKEVQNTVLESIEDRPVIHAVEDSEKTDMESYDKHYQAGHPTSTKPHAAWKEPVQNEPEDTQQPTHD